MADRIIVEDGVGHITEPISIPSEDGKLSENAVAAIFAFMTEATRVINGGLRLGSGKQSSRLGNLDGQLVRFVAPSVAMTEIEVPHKLGRTPIGRILLGQDIAGVLLDSNKGSWGPDRVLFKCSTPDVEFVLGLV